MLNLGTSIEVLTGGLMLHLGTYKWAQVTFRYLQVSSC